MCVRGGCFKKGHLIVLKALVEYKLILLQYIQIFVGYHNLFKKNYKGMYYVPYEIFKLRNGT